MPEQALKTAFGYFVLGMGVVVLLQELPMIYGAATAAAIVVLLTVLRLRRRRSLSPAVHDDETEQVGEAEASSRRKS